MAGCDDDEGNSEFNEDDDTANKRGGDPKADGDDECEGWLSRALDWATSERGRRCFAGGLAFAFASAEDIAVFAGVGLTIKGLKGVRAGTKLTRAVGRALYEKNVLLHPGARRNVQNIGWTANGFVGGATIDATMDAGVDGDFTAGEFLVGMVPGLNMTTAGMAAYDACTGG